jgi:hypothetical protein
MVSFDPLPQTQSLQPAWVVDVTAYKRKYVARKSTMRGNVFNTGGLWNAMEHVLLVLALSNFVAVIYPLVISLHV